MKDLSADEKKDFAAKLNGAKNEVSELFELRKKQLMSAEIEAKLNASRLDVTLPVSISDEENSGSIHPITKVIREVSEIFANMGFLKTGGPEIEDDFHNFTALNIPEHHPAKQMHDTFYLEDNDALMRTHTSPVQIRYMLENKPPFKIIAPGKTFRCDSDVTHSPMFHQVEALYVGENVNMGNLKFCLEEFLQRFFELDNIETRFRPSYFPFTEPSAEVDIPYKKLKGKIEVLSTPDKNSNWLEILGCGMVHPNVLKAVNIDSEKYQGFALGVGVERLAMLKYGMNDLRDFFRNNLDWLSHYRFSA